MAPWSTIACTCQTDRPTPRPDTMMMRMMMMMMMMTDLYTRILPLTCDPSIHRDKQMPLIVVLCVVCSTLLLLLLLLLLSLVCWLLAQLRLHRRARGAAAAVRTARPLCRGDRSLHRPARGGHRETHERPLFRSLNQIYVGHPLRRVVPVPHGMR